MFQERIDTIFEQTNFLVEKQKELFDIVNGTYKELLALIDKKINEKTEEKVLLDLNSIKKHVSDHYENLYKDINEDINFLNDQLKAITQIKDMQDKKKAEELLNMIISQEERLVETEEFKKQVEQDLNASKRELNLMKEDLLNALNEGRINELKLMLEAVKEHAHDLDEQEGSCSDEDCSTCSGCTGHETDIFEFFKEENKKDK